MKKYILLLAVCSLVTAFEQPAKKQKIQRFSPEQVQQLQNFVFLKGNDNSMIALRNNALFLAPCIKLVAESQSFLESRITPQVPARFVKFETFDGTTLKYFTDIATTIVDRVQYQANHYDPQNPILRHLLLKRTDGRLIPKNVYPVVEEVIQNIEPEELDSLIHFCNMCDAKEILNALARYYVTWYLKTGNYGDFIAEKANLKQEFGETVYNYMYKHLALKQISQEDNIQLHEMSVGDYIFFNPTTVTQQFAHFDQRILFYDQNSLSLNLRDRGITSLEGLRYVTSSYPKLIQPYVNVELDVAGNYILDASIDPEFVEKPFMSFPSIQHLNLSRNNTIAKISRDFFEGLIRVKFISSWENSINKIDPEAFNKIASTVEIIDLESNNLAAGSLSDDIFYEASKNNLQKVYLSYNPLCTFVNQLNFRIQDKGAQTTEIICESEEASDQED